MALLTDQGSSQNGRAQRVLQTRRPGGFEYVRVQVSSADPLQQPAAAWTSGRMLDICVAMVTTLILLTIIVRVLLGTFGLEDSLLAAAAALVLASPALMQRLGMPQDTAAAVFVVLGVATAAVTAWAQGGLSGTAATWLPIAPLLFSIVGSERTTALVGIICLCAVQALYWGQYLGIAPPVSVTSPAQGLANFMSVIILCVVVGVNHARTRASARRQEEEHRETLRVIAEESGAALVVVQAGRVRFLNQRARALLLPGNTEPLGLPVAAVLPASLIDESLDDATGGDRPLVRDDQVIGWFEVQRRPIRFLGQTATLLSAWDTSERRRLESDRVRAQARMDEARRLEQLGLLAGGVAHDFNNLLAAILANADLLARDLDATPQRDMVADITVAGRQASDLVAQLLAFAGRGAATRRLLDVRQVAEEAARIQRGAARQQGITVHFEPAGEPLWTNTDGGQLGQVLANLISNAVKASRAGQDVTVRLGSARLTGAVLESARLRYLDPGPSVLIEVEDQGAGMSSTQLDRIFDPFYTTRADGRGLGLAAVQGILQRLGGALLVDSTEGRGTRFTVALASAPVADAAVAATRDRASDEIEKPAASDPSAGWILVLDDEPLVRTQVVRVLARAGFEARPAATLSEAQALVAVAPPALAIIDYLMPDTTGEVALAQLRRDDPTLPAILMSGYIRPDAQAGVALFNDRLPKPFSLDDLIAKVRAHRRPASDQAAVSR
jgi:signal transduction histidine kinase/CheY-like chemotaxis protein